MYNSPIRNKGLWTQEKISGGERQKLSVVLSLIGNPEVVFLDELTTHYMEEAENLCDRICLIKKGQKVTEGTVREVIAASPYDNLEDAYLWYMGEE